MIDAVADRLQFEQAKLRDEIIRLQARVAALEASSPLPPEPKIELQPTVQREPESVPAPVPQPQRPETKPLEIPELDLLSGHGMTAGPRR